MMTKEVESIQAAAKDAHSNATEEDIAVAKRALNAIEWLRRSGMGFSDAVANRRMARELLAAVAAYRKAKELAGQ